MTDAMGATPHASGTLFRVWAPFARAVWVTGEFNGWSDDATPLRREDGERWSTDVRGAREGQRYRYAIEAPDGRRLSRIDPYAREVTSSVGDGIIRGRDHPWGDEGGYRSPSWDELVIYELHVGTFNDRPGGGPGSFASVANRLDYLRDLGITAIELMPSMEFAHDFSWGYNPAHIFAIEQAYGGPAALKDLVRTAHERGIAVIFDVVYNHLGPSDLDLWQFDGWSGNGKGGIYFYEDHRSRTPWGDTRPDYGRPEVAAFLRDNARYWLEDFRFDGLRWDATAYIRSVDGDGGEIPDGWRLMQAVTADTDARQPWKLHIAEDLRGNDWITRGTGEGGAGFDTQWDGDFVHPVRRALTEMDYAARSMGELRAAVGHSFGPDALRRVIYTESHDEVANGHTRLPEAIWPGNAGGWYARKRSTLGAALVFTTPGIPMIFQGQELLEDQWFRDDDPIDWTREERYAGVLRLYRDLIRLRRDRDGTSAGLRGQNVNVNHVNDRDKVITFHRWKDGGPGDDVVVVANFANRTWDDYRIGLPGPGAWKVRFNGDSRAYGPDYGDHGGSEALAATEPRDGMGWSAGVGLAPYTALVLSQDR